LIRNGNNGRLNLNNLIAYLLLTIICSIILSGSVSGAAITNNQTNNSSLFINGQNLITNNNLHDTDDTTLWISCLNTGYKIKVFDSSIGGNVLNNTAISQNIPRTDFSTKIFQMTNHGSVILKFGNGKGPKVLISAGIHGNEPQANIAIMKYLEFIKNKHFNGTLYIIPFAIPEDTALNTRYYNGTDPNRIANIEGSPSWRIVEFAKKNGVNYFIDLHSGGGVDSNGYIFINSESTNKEKKLVAYIVSKTNCSTGVDDADSPGMIRYSAHSYGINSITFETERDNIPVMDASNAEYKMIKAATKYLGFP
jgi:uncharacterized protein